MISVSRIFLHLLENCRQVLRMTEKFACPVCGFLVFESSSGSYEICPVCDWEDDPVQLKYPELKGGANRHSFWEAQQKILERIPETTQAFSGYVRDRRWRPMNKPVYQGPGPPIAIPSANTIALPLIVLLAVTLVTQLASLAYTTEQAFSEIFLPSVAALLIITTPLASMGLWLGQKVGLGVQWLPDWVCLLAHSFGHCEPWLRRTCRPNCPNWDTAALWEAYWFRSVPPLARRSGCV